MFFVNDLVNGVPLLCTVLETSFKRFMSTKMKSRVSNQEGINNLINFFDGENIQSAYQSRLNAL